jgi:hypothetical protein
VFSGLGWQGAAVLAPLMLREGIDRGVLQHNRGQLVLWAGLLLALGLFEALFGGTRHLFAIRNRALGDASSTRSATRSATCSPLSPSRR